jgi:Pyruvate/2-oxoacid:ferredoxin oxidoreductase delta subunit
VVPAQLRRTVLEQLGAADVVFHAVPDLCAMSARKDPILKEVAVAGVVKIIACFPRAVRWLFHAAGAALPTEGVQLHNMRKQSAEAIIGSTVPSERGFRKAAIVNGSTSRHLRLWLYEGRGAAPMGDQRRALLLIALLEAGYPVSRLKRACKVVSADSAPALVFGEFNGAPLARLAGVENDGPMHIRDITGLDADDVLLEVGRVEEELGTRKLDEWKPWFPVIDYDRCTSCMQCLSFCLFGVFGRDEKRRVAVRNPDRCKTNCPACSRVCPEVAILFPKYGKGPINGDAIHEEDLRRKAVKVDVSALLGGDAYKALRGRHGARKKRFSTERTYARALLERKRWLEHAWGDLDLPDEVPEHSPVASEGKQLDEAVEDPFTRCRVDHPATGEPGASSSQEEWGI